MLILRLRARVFTLLRVPFLPRKGISGEDIPPLFNSPLELSESRNEVFKRMFRLCYSLLRLLILCSKIIILNLRSRSSFSSQLPLLCIDADCF
ncbi:unnamed protein product [Gongylonema pulchrum]|uniref:Uncharacterized protein n=1 Tax=Gongylonema pulchrum TaxID=637853 RepID=A0A183DHU3_9BILA|nr:unnamed protein product [Gongylonema pulchrum]